MDIEKRNKIYQILKVTLEVKNCESECPLYYFCDEAGGICDYLEELDDKLLNE